MKLDRALMFWHLDLWFCVCKGGRSSERLAAIALQYGAEQGLRCAGSIAGAMNWSSPRGCLFI